MKPFDPDFSEISDDQLAAIDSLCSEYESSRTQGRNVSIEAILQESDEEIRAQLRLELIQIEMEILDAWDQLDSPDAMLERFPGFDEFIREHWESLKSRTGTRPIVHTNLDTHGNATTPSTTLEQGAAPLPDQATEESTQNADSPSTRFRIVRNLAHGGIGTVFVAFDRDLHREVAIKELKRKFANDRAVLQRFEAEATVTGNLEHPNIVPIYATGRRSDGRPYYAMRLIQGRSMQVAISELHRTDVLAIDFRNNAAARDLMLRFITVCRAVGFAHSRRVLHRDLKPSNIMVGNFGETLVVDWGLAKNLGSPNQHNQPSNRQEANPCIDSSKTLHGTIVGTPGYMSPEQSIGRNDEITVASDIYSLGATLFQLLTNTIPTPDFCKAAPTESPSKNESGRSQSSGSDGHPISIDTNTKTLIAHHHNGSKARTIAVPKPLEAICRKAMHMDPFARYLSAEMLAKDLEAWLVDEPVSVLPDTATKKFQRWAKAHPIVVGGGIAGLCVTLLAMGVTLSMLSVKNESLRQSYLREQASAQESSLNAAIAKENGEEAVRQRQRVLGILNTFLFDVERGLANVPGSAAVQRNVLTTVLNKLGEVSQDFTEDQVNLSNATALVELGDLFARVGTKDIKLEWQRSKEKMLSPLEAAGEMYAEAMEIAKRSTPQDGKESRRMIATIKQKQAEVLRQTARTPESLVLLKESLEMRRTLLAESPDSTEAALDVVAAVDYGGQIHLQDGDFKLASAAFVESQQILERLSQESSHDIEIKRRLGIVYSRIGDIAVHDGNLELATQLYDKDLAIATELYLGRPDNVIAKRDLCTSLDRIGNMSAERGLMEKAMDSYLESRRLREELRAAEPANLKLSQELFVSYMKGGDTRMLLKDVGNAQSDYKKALELADDLARSDPQNVNARRYQSLSAEVLADVAISQKQLDEALQYAKRSLAISLELVAKDPTDGQMQRDLYICYVKVAKVLIEQGDFENGLMQLDLALSIVKQSYERKPDSLQSMGDYSFVLLKRAEAYLESGNALMAKTELETIIPMLESVPEANRQDAKSRRRIANAITMLGRALLSEGENARARDAFERARQLTLSMIDEKMRVEQMQLDLSEIEGLISSIDAK